VARKKPIAGKSRPKADHGHAHGHGHAHDHSHEHEHGHDHGHGRALPVVAGAYPSTVPDEHRRHGPASVACAVVTVSDSKTAETDRGGPTIRESLERAKHSVAWSRVVRDEVLEIRSAVESALADPKIRAVVLTGGTGLTRRDVTPEALAPLFEKEIPGFGELFRMLSHREIGSAALLSRACAGTSRGKPIFALPGSPAAVRLAMDELVVRELGHLVEQLSR
jgi:molybdenum cofactor biosynthesis protein B